MECYSAFPVTRRQETREMYKKLDQVIKKKKKITPPNKKSYVSNEVKPVTHACSLPFQISCI